MRFLATCTEVRGTWGLNEDVYLAEIRVKGEVNPVVVRLVDSYPNQSPPLSAEQLKSQAGTVMRLRRDLRCDRPFGAMLLRTAPGDPLAIVPERLGYEPQMERVPDPGAELPCYTTVRW